MKRDPAIRRPGLTLPFSFAAALLLAACQEKPQSARGFHLPEGDVEKGKEAFVQLECHLCHRVKGVELPPVPAGPRIDVPLGGEVHRVKTYGDLLTAVINPKHFVGPRWELMTDAEGKSVMPEYKDRMTVAQMIDLVAFLHSRYTLTLPDYKDYYYGP